MFIRVVGTLCALLTLCNSAGARAIESWTFEELNNKADIVIIASVISTEPFDELLDFDRRHPNKKEHEEKLSMFDRLAFPEGIELDGQLTTFKVATVLKGKASREDVKLVHFNVGENFAGRYQGVACAAVFRKEHYRFQKTAKEGESVKRIATGQAQHYMLFLKARKDGKFEPVSGQVDSAFSAIELQPQLAPLDE